MMVKEANEKSELVINAEPAKVELELSELWRHRDLLRYLILREVYSVYANSAIGLTWVVLYPLLTAFVLTLVFAVIVRVPTEGMPYALVILSAYPFYSYFNNAVSRSANSMRANSHLLSKVYFPRVIIVLVPLIACLVDLLVLLGVVMCAAPLFGTWPSIDWILLLIPIILTIVFALGVGLWVSLLTIHVPDVGHVLPISLQALLYLSPIVYPISLVPSSWRWFYDLNPMVGIVEAARWALLAGQEFPAYAVSVSALFIISILFSGIVFFRILEDVSADLV